MKLTKPQKSIYDMEKFAGGSIACICGSMLLRTDKTLVEMISAVNELYRLNDALRIRINVKNGELFQYISEYERQDIDVLLFDDKQQLDRYASEYAKEPINLNSALCEIKIVKLPDSSGILAKLHHIISDAWTLTLIGTQFKQILNDKTPVAFSYADYLTTEDNYLNSKRYKKDREFFVSQIVKCDEPIYFSEKTTDSFNSKRISCIISRQQTEKIYSFAEKHNTSAFVLFETAVAVYINKIKNNAEKFFIGTAVLNRTGEKEKNTMGMYINTVPVLIELDNTCSFFKNLEFVETSSLSVLRHQKYNYGDFLEELRRNHRFSEKLYDVFISYQNAKVIDGDVKSTWYPNGMQTESLQIHIDDRDSEGLFQIHYDYQIEKFTDQDILNLHKHISTLLFDAIDHPEKNICDLDMLSDSERQTLLAAFNAVDYPRDKCVHELFKAQAERTPEKTALVAMDKTLTYRELNEESNRIAHSLIEKGVGKGDIVGLMLPRKSCLLTALFGILKTGAAYLPIDMELPKERIEYMCKDTNAVFVVSSDNIDSLLESDNTSNPQVEMTNDALCYCIYTSGSTGQPKGVMARHRNVVNYISKNEHNIFGKIVKDDFEAILSISTCSFDIFVTETIATLVNGLRVVLADEQQCRNQYALNKLLSKEKGEFLQTTPTKLKVLTAEPTQRDFLKNVKAILLGGEAMEMSYLNELKGMTDAKIYNIYGTTEVPIWSTFADTDTFIDAVTVGKPIANTQVHIVDKYLRLVPVGVMGELCIAGDSVSAGYLNRPELTAEKFVDNPFGEGKMYRTGDNAYWREDGNIVYIGRNDFQVKIRGLRIELGEIESVLQTVEGIERAVVVVRKDNEDRQLICAFYTGEEKEAKSLRTELGINLPKYMIPHIFTHLPKMPMTASGKADRNALPAIDLENIDTSAEYVAPETEEEKILAQAVKDVLGNEEVSMLDNFFDIGGDSLKAIELTSRLEAKGYETTVKTIFESDNMQSLAKKLTVREREEEKAEYSDIIPATPAQMRVYTGQFMSAETPLYNIPNVFRVEELNAEKLETALNKLIERHESLRTRFENQDGQIVQIIEDKAEIKLQKLESDNIQEFIKPFDLTKAPLLRAGYYEKTVMIDIHHIIADGETMPVFFRELNELYMGRNIEKIPVQYGEFAVEETNTEESEKYWIDIFSDEIPDLELPIDYQRKTTQSFKGTIFYDRIEKEVHDKITDKCKELNITPYVFYMTCYNILLSKYSGNEDIVVGMPISGRNSKYLESVGMFVNTVALRSKPEASKTISQFMQEVKENSISAIDNQNYPFNNLVKKLNIQTNGRNPLYDVMMAYQSYEMTDIDFGDKKAELLPIPTTTAKCDINFNVMPRENDVVFAVEYCTELYKEKTVQKFINSFKLILEQCLEENTLIKNIIAMSEDEIQHVLYALNDTAHEYDIPETATIYSLFEDTASRIKSKTCVTADGKTVTFGDLLSLSESLDSRIREFTKGEKSIIAVIAERSVEMYAGIYGIIRGGNAYMPIAPDYPQERIEYMLKNSNAAVVVAQGKFAHLAGDVPCIDMTEFIADIPENNAVLPCAAEADDTAYVIYTSGSTGKPKGAKVSHRSAVNRILWMHEAYPLGSDDVILQKTPYTFDVSVWELFWWGMVGGSLVASKPDEHFLPAKILDEVYNHNVTHLHFVPSVFELFITYLEKHPDECYKFSSAKYVFLSGEALSASLVTRFYGMFDFRKVGLHNLYGPTECAVDVTYYDCTPDDVDPVPIGKPIYNTAIYITDKYMNCVPQGVTGELCIGGVNVGQGYLNNPELTAEKFLSNPFGEGRIYRTGDNSYIREDGEIIFCGRMDNQIKLNGQRIEIGEIETVIGNIDGVDSVAVILRKNNGRDILAAFWCGKETDEKTIRDICEMELPSYMVPGAVCQLDKMPLNPSGKLDRKALSSIEIIECNADEYKAPENDTEAYIAEVFSRILGVETIGRNSDFFELGGTSLSMIALLSEDFFKDVAAADFISNSTPRKLTALMNAEEKGQFSYVRTLKDIENSKNAIVLVPYAGGGAEAFAALVKSLSDRTAEYSLYYFDYPRSYEECENVAKELYEIAKVRKLYVYSHCAGSAVAMQIINILEEMQNGTVEYYVAGASIPPEKPKKDNFWNTVSDEMLTSVLMKAGAPFGNFSDKQISDMLMNFRKDTDFMTACFYKERKKVNCPVSVIISKDDLFTENFTDAERLWSLYAENVCGVHFIDTKTHYFQSDNSDELAEMILDIITE